MDLQLGTVLVLEQLDLGKTSPLMICDGPHSARSSELETTYLVAWFSGSSKVLFALWPVRGEDLVGLTTEEEIERVSHKLAHPLPHRLVPVID